MWLHTVGLAINCYQQNNSSLKFILRDYMPTMRMFALTALCQNRLAFQAQLEILLLLQRHHIY